ncbi:hypothetical protein [Streptomyces sp. NPDC002690]
MRANDNERHWVGTWHVPLNIAAMHLSGVLLCIGFCWIPAASAETYAQMFEMMIAVLSLHVAVQIPAGLLASRWAVRGQVVKAGSVAFGLAAAAVWTLHLCTRQEPSAQAFWGQDLGCLCVSLSGYVWLCTLRRSTVVRLVERFAHSAQTLAMWALSRPPRRGPH